jgi:CubicO group peptidase (beta-lactamase class C family)
MENKTTRQGVGTISHRLVQIVLFAGFIFMIIVSGCMTVATNLSGAGTNEDMAPVKTGIEDIDTLIPLFDTYAEQTFNRSGIPGMAVALVYNDTVMYMRCFGVRNITTNEPVTPDTRFQLASISKTFTSGTIATMTGTGDLSWDDPISSISPNVNFSDPWITEHVTIRDLLSHRTGLPEYASDELVELNFSRYEIISKLRLIPLSGQFRSSYGYSNIGITLAAEAAANKAGKSWDDLIRERIFVPAGMKNTSSRFADYFYAENHADTYPTNNGTLIAAEILNDDENSPAGGVSSTLTDMIRYARLQLNKGTIDGKRVIAADALAETQKPQNIRNFTADNFVAYGLGWEIYYDKGQYRVEHGGDLSNGVSTYIMFYPEEKRGIIVLTNGFPGGYILKKAIISGWDDLSLTGGLQKDWYGNLETMLAEKMKPGVSVISPLPTLPSAPQDVSLSWPLTTYTGSYEQDYYGIIRIETNRTGLMANLSLNRTQLSLDPYEENTFRELNTGTGVNFTVDSAGTATAVHFTMLDKPWYNGTFFRISS